MSPSLIISIIAAVISAIAIGVSIWTHNRNHKLQARIVALEEAREKDRLAEKNKANLAAQIAQNRDGRPVLRILNNGFAEARNIKVVLDNKPVLEHDGIFKNQKEICQVGPQSSFQYLQFLCDQLDPPNEVKITWEDDSGEPGEYSTTLTL